MSLALDHYRLLGNSGLRISPLSLGTMTFGMPEWGNDFDEAQKMFNYYVERGGNFFDTANFYAMGESERILGKLIASNRERMVVATKYSLTMAPGDPNACGNHRKNMVQAVEASLKRLQTDYIDLYYLHVWDDLTPGDEILRALDDLVRAGKVLYAGISDTPAWQISRMQVLAELRGWTKFVALQIPYNLTERTVEREFMAMARELGLGVLPWSPLAGGVLTGKYRRDDLAADPTTMSSRKAINIASKRLTGKALEIAETVVTVAADLGCTPSQVALAWTLLNPAVTSPIIGARSLEQLQDNLGALDVEFGSEHRKRLDSASAIDPCFPYNMINGEQTARMFGGVNVSR